MKKLFKYILPLVVFAVILLPLLAHTAAPDPMKELQKVGTEAYGTTQAPDLAVTIGRYINIFLSLLGIIFVVLMVYAGYLWMTSMGAEEKVKKAKELITDAVIGLIILLAAYAISSFVVKELTKATTGI